MLALLNCDAWQSKMRSPLVACLAIALSHSAWGEDKNNSPSAAALNWVPLSEMTPEQLSSVPSHCCGHYFPPMTEDSVDYQTTAAEGSSEIYADRINIDNDKAIAANGNVRVFSGQQNIRAQSIVFDQEQQSSDVLGPITINESNALFLGQKAAVNQETGAARIEDGYFVLYESRMRGGAAIINRDENQVMTLIDGELTQCEPGDDDWILKGSEIKIDPNSEQGTVRDMRIEIGGVPVVYMPYWTFPTGSKSQSGLLYPSISQSDYKISDFSLPYFFALAPNYDLLVTPRFIDERGSMLELEGRYLNRHFDTVLSTAWLGNGKDDISERERKAINDLLNDPELDPAEAVLMAQELTNTATEFDGEDRWLIGLQHNAGSRSEGPRQAQRLFDGNLPKWYGSIDYTRVSDYAFFRHIDASNLDINRQTHLRQQGDLGYQFSDWVINLHTESYQTVTLNAQEPYRQLPRVDIDGVYQWPLASGDLKLDLTHEITSFRHREDFINDNVNNPRIIGDRFRVDYKLLWDKQWLWGFLKPGLAVKSLSYRLDSNTLATTADNEPGVTVPQATLDGGLFFERDGSWFGADYLQTFEPRIFYFYSDFESQDSFFGISANPNPQARGNINFDTNELTFGYSQLFRDSRFAGGDRIEDANQYSIGLTTRFLGRTSGQERLRLSLGQIFYNQDRRVTLNGNSNNNMALQTKSEIAGQIAAQLTDSWRLQGDALFDPNSHQWKQRNVSLRYYSEQGNILNLGYRHQRNPNPTPRNLDQEQAELSFVLPITNSWNIIGHTFHDFSQEEALDSMIGAEYNSCCYRVRVVGRRWYDNELIERVTTERIEHERGIFFEFEFRGLGGIGSLDSLLAESIYNFERRMETRR